MFSDLFFSLNILSNFGNIFLIKTFRMNCTGIFNFCLLPSSKNSTDYTVYDTKLKLEICPSDIIQ